MIRLTWLSLTVGGSFPSIFLFCRPLINRASSEITFGLHSLPPLWISSSRCINSEKVSIVTSALHLAEMIENFPNRKLFKIDHT